MVQRYPLTWEGQEKASCMRYAIHDVVTISDMVRRVQAFLYGIIRAVHAI